MRYEIFEELPDGEDKFIGIAEDEDEACWYCMQHERYWCREIFEENIQKDNEGD